MKAAIAKARRLMSSAVRRVSRPFSNHLVVSNLLASALVLGGFGAFFMGWRGAAATLVVGIQLAYLISGGVAGFALLGTGVGLLLIQISRHLAARERALLDAVLDESLSLLERTRAASQPLDRRDTTISRVSAELK